MSLAEPVEVAPRPVAQLAPVIGTAREARLMSAAEAFRRKMGGRTIWNISSTSVGGGVAEMLQVLLGYVGDLGVSCRWIVITGDASFFVITKRLHNHIHGMTADGALTDDDAAHYTRMLAANAAELTQQVKPGDLVILHDPQTAGLAGPLAKAGAKIAWRCHIGADWQTETTQAAWDFLRPYLTAADAFIFTRREYAPLWMPAAKVSVIPPSIDPLSAKNRDLDNKSAHAILRQIGVFDGTARAGDASFTRSDGGAGLVTGVADITATRHPAPADPLVVQVSRWDKLKDMLGVMRGFAEHVAPQGDGFLLLVGPAVAGVTDDPEGAAVFGDCLLKWRDLPSEIQNRVLLVTLPLDDIEENAAMVNALQRRASVIVQKSLAEGFGLTVAEGMWKGRPVVGSAVGGIIDQIAEGTGVLLPDPADLAAFGTTVRLLIDEPGTASAIGRAAKGYIAAHFVGDMHLLRYEQLLSGLIEAS